MGKQYFGMWRRYRISILVAVVGIAVFAGYCFYRRFTPTVTVYDAGNQPAISRIIFVGNSFTYFHDMPGLVAAMLAQPPTRRFVHVVMVAGPGLRFKDHYRSGVMQRLLQKEGPWDLVILQEQGGLAFVSPTEVQEYAKLLMESVIEAGAKPLLYVDWGSEIIGLPACEPSGLVPIGQRLGLEIVPIHIAWTAVHHRYPELPMEMEDGHPSPLGAYVTACTFYAVIASCSPEGLPCSLQIPVGTGKYLPWNLDISPDVAHGIQAVVWRVVQEWQVEQDAARVRPHNPTSKQEKN